MSLLKASTDASPSSNRANASNLSIKLAQVNFENEWREMQPPLASLVTGTPQTLTNEKWLKMYSGIYKICTNPGAPQAEMLFFRLRGLLVKHVEAILKELNTIDGEPSS
ncbi:Cullin repeat-like-containing domain [Phytophthora cactorum]|nr:Cullin repeat-like-containing domain [Phytophthora cactorum]